jgi:hypothetical protein
VTRAVKLIVANNFRSDASEALHPAAIDDWRLLLETAHNNQLPKDQQGQMHFKVQSWLDLAN